MKTCSTCKVSKPYSEFNKNTKDKLQRLCRDCSRAYAKARYAATREESKRLRHERKLQIRQAFAEYKSTLSCELCPENHPAALDFHHRDGAEKDATVSEGVHLGWSMARLKEEISKCSVLCSNCHRKLHWNERMNWSG